MKNIFTFLICLLSFLPGSTTLYGQACIPNNDTISGIEPDTLAVAFTNVPYEEVIYFRLPEDTMVPFIILGDTFLLHVCIDSLTIDSVHGLPEGFSFACHVPWCSVKGGDNGCAAITGVTQDIGVFPLEVFVTIYVNDCDGFELPKTVDTVTFYFIEVVEPSSGYHPGAESKFTVTDCFPNPASDEYLISAFSPHGGSMSVSVLDLQGRLREHHKIRISQGYSQNAMDASALEPGNYLLQLEHENKTVIQKLNIFR